MVLVKLLLHSVEELFKSHASLEAKVAGGIGAFSTPFRGQSSK
jgi:hypothetical protein